MSRDEDDPALGRSRGARGGFGQGPHGLPARGLPADHEALRLLPGEVHGGVHGEDQRRRGARRTSTGRPAPGTSRWAIRIRTGRRHALPARRASTPRATTSGRPKRADPSAVREHLRAADAARAVPTPRRAADLPHHAPRGAGPAFGGRAARAARRAQRDRRAPPRVGDTAVHRRRRPPPPVRARRCRTRSSPTQVATLSDAIDEAVGAAPAVVPVGPVRVLGRRTSRRSNAPGTASSRASRRCSTRRTRADLTSSGRRNTPYFLAYDNADHGRAPATCSRFRCRRRCTGGCPRGSQHRGPGRPGTTRRSASCGSSDSRD